MFYDPLATRWPEDKVEALRWYLQAANAGNIEAMTMPIRLRKSALGAPASSEVDYNGSGTLVSPAITRGCG